MTLPADLFPKYMKVIDYIRQGRLPTSACRQAEVSWTQMKKAMAQHPDLANMFEEALLDCRDHMLEILVEINNGDPRCIYGETDAKMATVISNNIKWVLERMWPEKFVQRLKVETNRSDEVIIAALQTAQMGMALSQPHVVLPLPAPLPLRQLDVIDLKVLDPELADLI